MPSDRQPPGRTHRSRRGTFRRRAPASWSPRSSQPGQAGLRQAPAASGCAGRAGGGGCREPRQANAGRHRARGTHRCSLRWGAPKAGGTVTLRNPGDEFGPWTQTHCPPSNRWRPMSGGRGHSAPRGWELVGTTGGRAWSHRHLYPRPQPDHLRCMRWRFRPALGSPSPYRRTLSIMPSNTIRVSTRSSPARSTNSRWPRSARARSSRPWSRRRIIWS